MSASRRGFVVPERTLRLALASVIGTLCLLGADLVWALLSARDQLASVWELSYGVLWLLPGALALGLPAAGLGALHAHALFASGRNRGARISLSAAWFLTAGAVAFGVSGGRHLGTPGARFGFTSLVAGAAATLAWFLAPRLRALLSRFPRAGALLVAIGVGLLELLNRFSLPGLYPAWHAGLGLAALALAPLAAVTLADRDSDGRAGLPARSRLLGLAGLPLVLFTVAALLAEPAARQLSGFDNFRLILLEKAPLHASTVRFMAALAPSDLGSAAPGAKAEPKIDHRAPDLGTVHGSGLSLVGRDLLLITVDALRADHLGAYGYTRPVSPEIDTLARQGVVFEHAYSATPHTSYAIASLLTGKYMRPLLLQGAGADSETWPEILKGYEYRTAGFYPPAVFFIDTERFESFRQKRLGFEYYKEEFAEGQKRLDQVARYLETLPADQRVFLWVHWFGPHEPYELHPRHAFGERDVDRYDSEIAETDESIGRLVRLVRSARPQTAIFITADHGEEFSEHGGRYHGTSVYEEQVRVPLVVQVPGVAPRRVAEPVQTIDLMPTVLRALEIPRVPRVRGRDLGPLIVGTAEAGPGLAVAETDEHVLLAEGRERLICARKVGACRLYDLTKDPTQSGVGTDASPERLAEFRARLQAIQTSHGRFEEDALLAQGRIWPVAIRRAAAGDVDTAGELAALLDDADVEVRRRAAELLFELHAPETAEALRLALGRADDSDTERWCALALTRLGQGASLTHELLRAGPAFWKRRAALALAETGDRSGEAALVDWWLEEQHQGHDHAVGLALLEALGRIRAKSAVWALTQSLVDVRLRPRIAETLATIGDKDARGPLVVALAKERSQTTREALARAAVALGAGNELAAPLARLLGVPEPLPNGLGYALEAKVLKYVGGPDREALERLRRLSSLGTGITVVIPSAGNGRGVRALVRARALKGGAADVHIGQPLDPVRYDADGKAKRSGKLPRLDAERSVRLRIPATGDFAEVYATLPETLGARPGASVRFVVYAEQGIEVDAIALVPLQDETAVGKTGAGSSDP